MLYAKSEAKIIPFLCLSLDPYDPITWIITQKEDILTTVVIGQCVTLVMVKLPHMISNQAR